MYTERNNILYAVFAKWQQYKIAFSKYVTNISRNVENFKIKWK